MNQNINTLWTSLIIDELIKNGITYFCISPGYRSAPLIHALVENPQAEKIICIDERAAAYHALGYAKGTGKAAVLVCTSGTALGNYYPGLMEASQDQIPLIVLSSDRPPELIHTDANQTIDQTKFYGEFQKFFLNLPCPTDEEDLGTWMGKIGMVAHLSHLAPKGPVHINCPFRDPLEPLSQTIKESFQREAQSILQRPGPWTQQESSEAQVSRKVFHSVAQMMSNIPFGLLVVGRLSSQEDSQIIQELVKTLGWPVYYDIGSSLKHEGSPIHGTTLWDFDFPPLNSLWEKAELRPKIVLHLGGRSLSKNYYHLLKRYPEIQQILVHDHPLKHDPSQRTFLKILSSVESFVRGLLEHLPIPKVSQDLWKDSPGGKIIQQWQKEVKEKCEQLPFSYLKVAYTLSTLIPEDHILYLGNSTPIRAFEATTVGMQKKLKVAVHRGVSGIEGFVAAACGMANGTKKRITLVLGDLALLHDLNSLGLLKDVMTPMIIIVVNNFSGGIFTRLPLAQYPEVLHPYISTPHQWDFCFAAKQFHLDYALVQNQDELMKTYQLAVKNSSHLLMEILLENNKDNDVFTSFLDKNHYTKFE